MLDKYKTLVALRLNVCMKDDSAEKPCYVYRIVSQNHMTACLNVYASPSYNSLMIRIVIFHEHESNEGSLCQEYQEADHEIEIQLTCCDPQSLLLLINGKHLFNILGHITFLTYRDVFLFAFFLKQLLFADGVAAFVIGI